MRRGDEPAHPVSTHRRAFAPRAGALAFELLAVLLASALLAPQPMLGASTDAAAVTGPSSPDASSADPVLVGAGDISTCANDGDEATAKLLDAIPGTVFTAGDTTYESGTDTEFASCYDASWGRHKARTRPSVGNHEYLTAGASGYFSYFGPAAGDPAKGYYAYDLGAWRIYAINSNCSKIGGCGTTSAQYSWLKNDLAANPRTCVAAYWHHPRFSSGQHGNFTSMQPIWQALYDAGAELVVNGHDHDYERFAPQRPDGTQEDAYGIREIVAGTGGKNHYGFAGAAVANSEVRNSDTYGVLKLTLHAASYDWQFVPEAGKTFTDSGSTVCHDQASSLWATASATPTPAPTATATVAPTPTASVTPTASEAPAPAASETEAPTAAETQAPAALEPSSATDLPTSATGLAPSPLPASDVTGVDPQPSFPIRAAFYYPWFPELWTLGSKYTPSLGYYDSGDGATIQAHVRALSYGNVKALIASWWGQNQKHEETRIPALLANARLVNPDFRTALYYEKEGSGNPSESELRADLEYIRTRYGTDPGYLRVNGRQVVFVYNANDTSCALVDRWKAANNTTNSYLVLKVFTGWDSCPSQPDGWHQYGPSTAYHSHIPSSPGVAGAVNISPGFWHKLDADPPGGDRPYLARDLSRWNQNIRDMVASGAPWQLVTSFNEWGEGTSVESAREWASSSGHGAYLDALHNNGTGGTSPSPTPSATASAAPQPSPSPTTTPAGTATPQPTATPAGTPTPQPTPTASTTPATTPSSSPSP
ncbi:MAG: metallophosphoesterase, partial [Chloroflexota bacterium]|nr:metallophosphoesterase [Chloroflexota bacterium]